MDLCLSINGRSSGFFIISAVILSVGQYYRQIITFSMFYRTVFLRIAICFACGTPEKYRNNAPFFLLFITVGCSCRELSSSNIFTIQIISLSSSLNSELSVSVNERAIVLCFIVFYETKEMPINNRKFEVDFRSAWYLSQSASQFTPNISKKPL